MRKAFFLIATAFFLYNGLTAVVLLPKVICLSLATVALTAFLLEVVIDIAMAIKAITAKLGRASGRSAAHADQAGGGQQ